MRDLFLTVILCAGLIYGLRSAPGSILVLNWIWFQRPYDFSWGVWNTLPMFQMALGVAICSNLIRGQFQLKWPPLLLVYFGFLVWVTLSCLFAYDPNRAWLTYKAFLPSMWIAPIVLFATIHKLQLIKWVLWIAAGGIGINAFKVGLVLTAKGGGYLTDEMSGFVGDNNVFGLVLCLVVAILLGLRATLHKRWWLRLLFYIFIGFIVITIIYTRSRGALLTLGIILVSSSLLSSRPIRNSVFLMLLVCMTYAVIPSHYFDRLSTLQNVEADISTVGRVENWKLSWNEALEFPLFGVGPDNHIPYNRSVQSEVQVRVAHSVYFQVLGELGFVGLGFYLGFVSVGVWTLFRTWRAMVPVASANPDLAWVRDVAFWMTCGYVGYVFGSGSLNMLYVEFPWYVILYGSMLWPLVSQEIAREKNCRGVAGTMGTISSGHRSRADKLQGRTRSRHSIL